MENTALTSSAMRRLATLAVMGVTLLAAANAAWSQTKAPATARADDRGRIANIVRDLLVNDPTLLRDAMQALQARENAAREAARAQALQGLATELARETDTPSVGPADADATLVEFYDYQCSYCKRAIGELRTLKQRDTKVRIIYKDLPILGPESVELARASLAVNRQGRFEAFHDALMAMERPDRAAARQLAERLGVDMARFDRDLADPALVAALERNRRQAEALDIDGTPAFVIGSTLLPGVVETETLVQLLKALRAQKSGVGAR